MKIIRVPSKSVTYLNAKFISGYFIGHPQEDIWLTIEKEGAEDLELNVTFSEALAMASILLTAMLDLLAFQLRQKQEKEKVDDG